MYRESYETLEDKIDFLFGLLTDEQFDEYSNWCDDKGYYTESYC